MVGMLPVVFMAGPVRRPPPTPAEIAAAERGRLRAREEIAAREAAEEHAAKTNRMARIESRLPKLKEATEATIRQMHRELLGPEIGQTAHGQKKGFLGGRLWADKSEHLEATRISPDKAKKRAVLAKSGAEGLVRAHNALVAEWNRVSDALGRDPALRKRPINLDALVDALVKEDRWKIRLKGLPFDDGKANAMARRHTQEFDL